MKNIIRFKKALKNESTINLKKRISVYEDEIKSNMERILEISEEKNHSRINGADYKYLDMMEELDACREELQARVKVEENTL